MIQVSYTEKNEDKLLQENEKIFQSSKEVSEFLRSLRAKLGSRLVGNPMIEEVIR